jgi:hypothetical protein
MMLRPKFIIGILIKSQYMTLKEALMNGQDMSESDAVDTINEMRDRVREGEDPSEVLADYGLEPDYFIEILHI